MNIVIQERRKFGPLGWNVKYDFNNSDLECAMCTLHMFLEEQADIPWPALLYVTGIMQNAKCSAFIIALIMLFICIRTSIAIF